MGDYRVLIKVKNHRILKAIEDRGYKSVNAFCNAHGLHQNLVGDYINLKKPALLKNGKWADCPLAIADALLMDPADLFSEAQQTMRLDRNEAQKIYSETQMLQMVNDTPEMLMMKHDTTEAVHKILDKLRPREKAIMCMRFGIGYSKDHTLKEVAKKFNVTGNRIQNIEKEVLRRLSKSGAVKEIMEDI